MKIVVTFFCFIMFFFNKAAAQSPSLDHIAVYVTNLQQSTRFYQQIVGLDTIPEPFHDGRHTWFKLGKSALHLIQGASAGSKYDKNNHLCFRVKNLDRFIQKLTEAGIAFENWAGQAATKTVRTDGVQQIYFKDPDGHWIEVNNARK